MDKEKLVDGGFLDMGVCCPECQSHLVREALGSLSDHCIVLSCRNMNCSLCDVRWKPPSIKLERAVQVGPGLDKAPPVIVDVFCPRCENRFDITEDGKFYFCGEELCSLHGIKWVRSPVKVTRAPDPEPYTDEQVAKALMMVVGGYGQDVGVGERDSFRFAIRVLKWHLGQIEAASDDD